MERYTITDAHGVALRIIGIAKEAGFNIEGWGVERGSGAYTFAYRLPGQATLTVYRIGSTAREAVGQLNAFMAGMSMMRNHLDTPRQVKLLSAALRASVKLQEHRHKCGYCSLHLVGAKPDWCNAYKTLLEVWSEGIVIAHADHKQKYPIGAALTQAISG